MASICRCFFTALLFTTAAVLSASSAKATVIYDFSAESNGGAGAPAENIAFQLIVPDFVIPPTNSFVLFSCSQLNVSTNCGLGVLLEDELGNLGVQFDASNGWGYGYVFPTGSFTTTGYFESKFPADLTIASAPEPGSGAFVSAAALLLLFARFQPALHRDKRKVSP